MVRLPDVAPADLSPVSGSLKVEGEPSLQRFLQVDYSPAQRDLKIGILIVLLSEKH
jgi:hypothetical protein